MIFFSQRIARAFLDAQDHPINIPVEHHYRLRSDGAVSKSDRTDARHDAIVVLPDGKRLGACIYYGEAGGRFYYQIRISPQGSLPLRRRFQNELFLHVFIVRTEYETVIYLLDELNSLRIQQSGGIAGGDAEKRMVEELQKIADLGGPAA